MTGPMLVAPLFRFFAIFMALVFLGCNGRNTNEQPQTASHPRDNRSMILGIWRSAELPQSAAFQVNDSTFYYPDEFVERKYTLKDDSLFIALDDGSVIRSAIMNLSADSMILMTNGAKRLYTRTEPAK